jgi:cadmium resistance protein CadD (predicted permease)
MDHPLTTVGTAVALFAGTNVDDLLVLTVLFLAARTAGRPAAWQVWLGQYLGIAVLVAVSAVAALGLLVVPDRWVGLLGLVPLALGLRGLLAAARGGAGPGGDDPGGDPGGAGSGGDGSGDGPAVPARGALAVAGVTVANGADNLAVYTPVFRTFGPGTAALTVAVFAVLVAVWCLAGSWTGSHPRVVAAVRRGGRWLVPGVFTAVGAVILAGAALR